MNKAFGFLAVLLILSACSHQSDQRAAAERFRVFCTVTNVIDLQAAASREATHTRYTDIEGHEAQTFWTDVYLDRIHRIDFSACPAPFQKAWLDYVHAMESFEDQVKRNESSGRKRNATNARALLVSALTHSLAPLASLDASDAPINDQTLKAWQDVESSALVYGVTISTASNRAH